MLLDTLLSLVYNLSLELDIKAISQIIGKTFLIIKYLN